MQNVETYTNRIIYTYIFSNMHLQLFRHQVFAKLDALCPTFQKDRDSQTEKEGLPRARLQLGGEHGRGRAGGGALPPAEMEMCAAAWKCNR